MIRRRIIKTVQHSEWTLYGEIKRVEDYKELIEDLETAEDDDVIILKINSPGGCVSTGMMIVQAIQGTRATVVARVVYTSYSMASLIAMACHALYMDADTALMFHAYSGGTYGKGDDLIQYANEGHVTLHNIFSKLCKPFLTKKEFDTMWQGKDLYIHWNDDNIKQRIKRHYKWQNVDG